MSRVSAFIARMGDTCVVHSRDVTIARTAPTNWPDRERWADTADVRIFVDEVITREVDTVDGGRITEKKMKAFVGACVTIAHMDRITYDGELFEVESVPTIKHRLDVAEYIKLDLVRLTP